MEWSDLKKYDNNPPGKALDREKGIQVRYGYYLKSFRKKGTTVGQVIIKNLFDKFESDRFVITRNEFPYKVSPGIAHLVLWMNPLHDATESEVRQYLADRLLRNDNTNTDSKFIMYMNKSDHQSIVDIPHYQLFVKTEDLDKLKIEQFDKNVNNHKK